jgi:5-methylcytosine-specific restriction endonuclease McrA
MNRGAQAGQSSSVRFLLKLSISKGTYEKLRYAQALLSHAVPTGDAAGVFDRALDTLIATLEKRKFGTGTVPGRRSPTAARSRQPRTATTPPRPETTARKRYIPTQVRRAVWERDEGRCTFVGANGHRCEARRFLEFDHIEPVARGGRATVEGMRLRCRTHNRYEAERIFGAAFMDRKLQEARLARAEAREAEARARAGARAQAAARAQAEVKERATEVRACLRRLGCRAEEARRAAEVSATLHGATLEERLRAALQSLRGTANLRPRPPAASPAGARNG